MIHIETSIVGLFAIATYTAGKSIAVISQLSPSSDWVTQLAGSGALTIGAGFVIKWLVGKYEKGEARNEIRHERADAKAEVREIERDEDRKIIIEMTMQNQAIISQNSAMLASAKLAIEKCMTCETKHIPLEKIKKENP